MRPIFVISAFLHFKKNQNFLQTRSLLDKNLPNCEYPTLYFTTEVMLILILNISSLYYDNL